MTFDIGSLVRARGREWVVLPESTNDFLVVRPLGGADADIGGILPSLEHVERAVFPLPDPTDLGDFASARLLHEALRLSVRSSAGPFRSFGRIAVDPRPYQLVPLLMALKLDPVRILIADDVGIGKTVEALLIARELMDRGEAPRLSVLCLPHLAKQWQAEMRDKFHMEAELVLASTAGRLERDLPAGVSIFEQHPITVVSLDFIRTERHRDEYLRAAPDLVIVDEAHTCADAAAGRGSRHLRHRLLRGLADKPDRSLILVTATPHSGSETAFAELTGFLNKDFRALPEDLTRDEQRQNRERLAKHFVQRRRGHIRQYMDTSTAFPERLSTEVTYRLSPEYRAFFDKVLKYARESVKDPTGGSQQRQRVRYWAAIALLQAIGSSPAAAAATLTNRASPASATSAAEVEEVGQARIYDTGDESSDGIDVVDGADTGDEDPVGPSNRRRLQALAAEARTLVGKKDAKLAGAVRIVRDLLANGRTPIVFCRFINTAEYVRDGLREALGDTITVRDVTGSLPAEEREAAIAELGRVRAGGQQVVLVATDCLSEGVNLQETFDAVVHYDLSWNPTRQEQREGRVDRFLQPKPDVAVVTYYGENSPIDGHVLKVLLRKHQQIAKATGVSVPVPGDMNKVLSAMLEKIIFEGGDTEFEQLVAFEELTKPLHEDWDKAAEKEKVSRSLFAQASIKPDEVAAELRAARDAVGRGVEVRRFVTDVLERHGAKVVERGDVVELYVAETPRALRDVAGLGDTVLHARFEPPRRDKEEVLTRTHPIVGALAGWIVDTALDPEAYSDRKTRRCGVIRTTGVRTRTTALLIRARYDLRLGSSAPLLAEDVHLLAFEGTPHAPTWLPEEEAQALLDLQPSGLVLTNAAQQGVETVVAGMTLLQPVLEERAQEWANALRAAHERVRSAGIRTGRARVAAHLPLDILGIYQFLPHAGAL